nr:uncharacterized protein LOC129482512 isoform X1 [Symphalangus syndactylus]
MCSAPGELKLRPFLASWSPALSCVSLSAKVGPPRIDRPRVRWLREHWLPCVGPVFCMHPITWIHGGCQAWRKTCTGPNGPSSASVSQVPSPWCTEDRALPGALVSCPELWVQWQTEHQVPHVCDGPVFHVDLITWVHRRRASLSWHTPPSAGMEGELFCPGGPLVLSGIVSSSPRRPPGIDWHRWCLWRKTCLWVAGSRPVVVIQVPSLGALKLRPFLVSWSPALSCDGEPRGRIALGLLAPGQCPSARRPAPSALKLRPSWCPGLLH